MTGSQRELVPQAPIVNSVKAIRTARIPRGLFFGRGRGGEAISQLRY